MFAVAGKGCDRCTRYASVKVVFFVVWDSAVLSQVKGVGLQVKRRRFRAILADLDGTLYFKKKPFPWAAKTVQDWKEAGFLVRFLTNTDSKSVHTLHQELREMGLCVPEEELFTPVTALFEFLKSNPGKRCYCLLSEELGGEFAACAGQHFDEADYVIVGDFRENVRYSTLNTAFRYLMSGADLIALQKGRYFVAPDGPSLDTGSFVALLEFASGKTARVFGKPSADFFQMALNQLGCPPEEAIVIGDDTTTDIAGAGEIGAYSVLVRTGKFKEADLLAAPVRPDAVLDSAHDLLAHLGLSA